MYASPQAMDFDYMDLALDQARKSLSEGGIPIGSILVIENQVVSVGHNQRVQLESPILHGEMDCLNNAKRLTPKDYQKATLYTTLSPCSMCSGTILLYKIPRVVMAENETFQGAEQWLFKNGIELCNLDMQEAKTLMQDFIQKNPTLWNEDIGEDES